MSTLIVHGHTVRIGDRAVATLTFGAGMVTVKRTDGTVPGRLLCESPGRYSPWTAASPVAASPADRKLGNATTLEAAVAAVLGNAPEET